MKKICTVIFIASFLFIFSTVAFAKTGKNIEIDESYNFSNIHRIFIKDTDVSDKKIFDKYFKKMKCEFIFEDNARNADVFVETDILEKNYEFSYRVPEKVTYKGWINEKVYNSKTKRYEKKRRYKESSIYFLGATMHVQPAYDVYKSSTKMQFKLCEYSSGKILMNYFIERNRFGKSSFIDSLYMESWKYFLKDFKKLMKNPKKFIDKNKNFK